MYSVLGSLAKDMVILLWLSLRDLFADFLSFFFGATAWPCRLDPATHLTAGSIVL